MGEPPRPVEDDVDELELLTRPGREEDLRTFLLLLHPADVAELVTEAKEETAVAILRHLEPERAAGLLSELDPEDQERVLARIRPEELAPILEEMATDDAADLLQELDEQTAERVLAELPAEDRREMTELLRFDPDSAGGLMQTELVAVYLDATVAEVIEAVRKAAGDTDIISVFVIDHAHRYAGHVALQDLVLSRPDTLIEHIMTPKVVEVAPDLDQEEVARIFDHYSLVELGVVDEEGKLVGRITADDVHEVLVEEAGEDMLKMAGTRGEPEALYSGEIPRVVWQRLPWLASTLLAGLFGAYILASSRVVFEDSIMLLAFVPLITGMGRNAGSQSALIMVRGMAEGYVERRAIAGEILQDTIVSGVMAATCGLVVALVVGLWQGSAPMGLTVGCAVAGAMVVAGLLGASEPALFEQLGLDPTLAASPLVTSINDLTSIGIYALVSALFLGGLA